MASKDKKEYIKQDTYSSNGEVTRVLIEKTSSKSSKKKSSEEE